MSSPLQSESIRAQVEELRERGFVVARGLVG
ncbi:phytanoyl-CoA dioxygenase family protein, partial [Pseudomonas sp. MWU13-2625]